MIKEDVAYSQYIFTMVSLRSVELQGFMLADILIISVRTYFLTWLFVVGLLHKIFSTTVEQPYVLIAFLIAEESKVLALRV